MCNTFVILMKSNRPKTVGSNPEIVRNHPIHPTGTSPVGILCSSYTHWARGPWGSVAVASCGADLSSHRVSTVSVGFGFIVHDATSRSKVVSFGTVRSAARRTVGNTGCNKLSIGRMRVEGSVIIPGAWLSERDAGKRSALALPTRRIRHPCPASRSKYSDSSSPFFQ